VDRLVVNPHVLCRFLRPSLTEVPSLRRSYPASLVVRTSPPPQTARPVSRELPVDRYHDHRWGFPCCVWSPMRTCHRYYPGKFNGACSLVDLHRLRPSPCNSQVGSPAIVFSGPAQRSLTLRPARSRSRLATLSIESSDSFVASAAVSIATGWSEPVPGRDFHPLKSSAFSRRTVTTTTLFVRKGALPAALKTECFFVGEPGCGGICSHNSQHKDLKEKGPRHELTRWRRGPVY
jgi:hypothetical protein